MRRAGLGAVAAVLALTAPAAAAGDPAQVSIQFAAFGPDPVDVLPGESVEWENVSERIHTVTADDGSFASVVLPGDTFDHQFDVTGAYAYHCTIHPSMTGEIDVRSVTLGPLPTAAVPAGQKVAFDGRTADPGAPVSIQRDAGSGFATVAQATPAADGSWTASVPATQTADYRAATDAGVSETRRLLVSDRKVVVRATRRGVAVSVTPALPYAQIVLQERLRERFGWWPARFARLDYVSEAQFTVARPARVRVALLDKDGWTPLVVSREVVLR
jgi:plastocyanin